MAGMLTFLAKWYWMLILQGMEENFDFVDHVLFPINDFWQVIAKWYELVQTSIFINTFWF